MAELLEQLETEFHNVFFRQNFLRSAENSAAHVFVADVGLRLRRRSITGRFADQGDEETHHHQTHL